MTSDLCDVFTIAAARLKLKAFAPTVKRRYLSSRWSAVPHLIDEEHLCERVSKPSLLNNQTPQCLAL